MRNLHYMYVCDQLLMTKFARRSLSAKFSILFAQIFCDIRKTVIENVHLSKIFFFYLSENFYSFIHTPMDSLICREQTEVKKDGSEEYV